MLIGVLSGGLRLGKGENLPGSWGVLRRQQGRHGPCATTSVRRGRTSHTVVGVTGISATAKMGMNEDFTLMRSYPVFTSSPAQKSQVANVELFLKSSALASSSAFHVSCVSASRVVQLESVVKEDQDYREGYARPKYRVFVNL